MGIQDRDYMRRGGGAQPLFHRSWWRRIDLRASLCIAAGVLAVGMSAIWFLRDAQALFSFAPAEGSLIVNINTATLEELESLPNIGPARAQLIVLHRPYATVDDLKRVNGIPAGIVEDLRPLIRTGGETRKR